MPPELSIADVYVAELCEEKHRADRAEIARLAANYATIEARLRGLEIRLYVIITILSLTGSAVGSLLGS